MTTPHRNNIGRRLILAIVLLLCFTTSAMANVFTAALACPFCTSIKQTLAEQMLESDAVVLATLIELPNLKESEESDELPTGKYQIADVLSGDKFVGVGNTFPAICIGQHKKGDTFLILGTDPPAMIWTTPLKMTKRGIAYLKKIPTLPEKGAKRLVFFQDYLEDEEPMLAFDAYDEFAQAPYEDIIALKDDMKRDRLLKWIDDPEVSSNRKRLYFTLLGVCGKDEDLELLEKLIKSDDRNKRKALDALIACYLNLKGESGLELVTEQFLKNPESEYVDTFAAITALRFHGTEVEVVPRGKIVASLRHVLDRPKMADMVIPDLARWEDWTVMEKLVELFKEAPKESNWVRAPVISYLRMCPKPEAKEYIEELRRVDADAVARAETFLDWEMGDDEDDEEVEESDATTDGDGAKSKSEAKTENKDSDDKGSKADCDSGANQKSGQDDTNVEPVSTRSLPAGDEKTRVLKVSLPSTGPDNGSLDGAVSDGAVSDRVVSENPLIGEYVSTSAAVADMIDQPSQPVAAASDNTGLVGDSATSLSPLLIIAVTIAICMVLFVLLWSVISGAFERLLF